MRVEIKLNVGILFPTLLFICTALFAAELKPAYLDPANPVEMRVDDLLGRMTLEEKVGQMNQYLAHSYMTATGRSTEGMENVDSLISLGLAGSLLNVVDCNEANYLQKLAENTRLGIPLIFGIDAVHGLAPIRGATVFPTSLGMAASFDRQLIEEASEVTAAECRVIGTHWSFFPVLDVAREPRWGRTSETFGEDPLLVREMGLAAIRGFQGDNLAADNRIIACIKHFTAHGQPLGGRNTAPMEVSERTLRSVYLPPFEAAVRAGARSLMAAYHENNGIPCHASGELLTEILRREWGFRGFVVSDWGGIEMLVTPHRVAATLKDAIDQAVNAGVDMHMQGDGFTGPLLELAREGKVPQSRIDEAVRGILRAKFELGLFEHRYIDSGKAKQVLGSKEHKEMALKAARESIVLLKNSDGVLPLDKKVKSILVTGPDACDNSIVGDWTAPQPAENVVTVLDGIRWAVSGETIVRYVDAGKILEETDEKIAEAARAAKEAEVAIVVVGGNETRYDNDGNLDKQRLERTGGEGVDRTDLNLKGRQLELVRAVYETGTPTVVVLVNGRPLSIDWIAENVPAIVEAWQPGMSGGRAIADVLFGDYNPGARLPISFPRSVGQLPVWYNHSASAEVDYKFGTCKPLYPFGYGLSYTEFEYGKLDVPAQVLYGSDVKVSVEVKNAGRHAGEECVLLYVTDNVSSVTTPVKQLREFRRIALQPGVSSTVSFEIPFEELSLYNRAMEKVVEPGTFTITVGSLEKEFEVLAE